MMPKSLVLEGELRIGPYWTSDIDWCVDVDDASLANVLLRHLGNDWRQGIDQLRLGRVKIIIEWREND